MSAGVFALALVLSGCDQFSESPTPQASGPPAAWSMEVDYDGKPVTVVNDVVIVPGTSHLFGVSRTTGEKLWSRDLPEDFEFRIASGLVVIQPSEDGPLEVVDPSNGNTRWKTDGGPRSTVFQDAIYFSDCEDESDRPLSTCTWTARRVRDGRQLWETTVGSHPRSDSIGTRKPQAPAADRYLVAWADGDSRAWAAVDVKTGKVVRTPAASPGWYQFALGSHLVVTDHDPPDGEAQCVVTVTVIDIHSGRKKPVDGVFSGHQKDGSCDKDLVHRATGLTIIGEGSRIAAVASNDHPQVFDLLSGKATWVGAKAGVPIDGDDHSILVRRYADNGELRLLDFESGKLRWSAPDPGLGGSSASWQSIVTHRLVAVSGATDNKAHVLVYDVDSGRLLGRYPGWLAGAGDDWVAVNGPETNRGLRIRFIEF